MPVEVREIPQPNGAEPIVAIAFTCSREQAACFAHLVWSHIQGGMIGHHAGLRRQIEALPRMGPLMDDIEIHSRGSLTWGRRSPDGPDRPR